MKSEESWSWKRAKSNEWEQITKPHSGLRMGEKNDLDSIKVSITFISYKSSTSSSNLNPIYGHRYMWLHFLPSNRKTKQRERTPRWKESI